MKKVNICNYSVINNEYYLSFNNYTHFKFQSKRSLTAFINALNTFLSDKLYQLNIVFADIFRIHRLSWMYFDNYSNSQKGHYLHNNININELIADITQLFENSVYQSTSANGSSLAGAKILLICDKLLQVSMILINIFNQRSSSKDIIELQFYINQVSAIKSEIINYKIQEAYRLTNTDELNLNNINNFYQKSIKNA
jgi:hypothetical protein